MNTPDWIQKAAEECAFWENGDQTVDDVAEIIRKHFDSASPWRKTSERAPTHGWLIAVHREGWADYKPFDTISADPQCWPYWMKIPELPKE